MLAIDGQSSAGHPKKQVMAYVLINRELSAVTNPIEKPILLNFVNFSTIFCPRLSDETDISKFLTPPRSLESLFSVDFSISKDLYALQIDI